MDVGYKHGKAVLELWAQDNKALLCRSSSRDQTDPAPTSDAYVFLPRPPSTSVMQGTRMTPSFTDLAALVKIQNPKEAHVTDDELSDLLEEDGSDDEMWLDEEDGGSDKGIHVGVPTQQESNKENLSVSADRTDEESLTEADRRHSNL